MTSITQRYQTFLEENDIENFDDLVIVLISDPYNIEVGTTADSDLVILSITEYSDVDNEYTCMFNGLIIDLHDISKIICYSGDYIMHITKDELNRFNFNLKGLKFYEMGDGEVIRIFYYDNEWIVSTTFSIDAENVEASSSEGITLKLLFDSCCSNMNFDYTKLNKDNVYTFGLYHDLNRNIIQHRYNTVAHLETYNKHFEKIDLNLNLPAKSEVTFSNISNLLEICKLSKYTTPGFIIVDENKNKCYKLLTESFIYVSKLKGEEKNLVEKYINLKRDNLLDEYLIYFKSEEELFNILDQIFNCKVEYFYRSYVDLKIRRIEKPLDKYLKHERDIINKIHMVYLTTRINTSEEAVSTVLKYYDVEKLVEVLTPPPPQAE